MKSSTVPLWDRSATTRHLRSVGRESGESPNRENKMSFIEINLDDVEEQKPAASGFYPLQITKCDVTETGPNSKKPGSPQYRVSIGFLDNPQYMNLTHYVGIPTDPADSFKALLFKRFLAVFNIPYDPRGIDIEGLAMQMVGASTPRGEVGITEPSPDGSVYNRLVTPRLANEPSR